MTWYPTTCPTWCAGKHPALLTPPSYDTDHLDEVAGADDLDEVPDAAELVTHSCTLTADQDAGTWPGSPPLVTLDQDEAHPASLHRFTAAPARLHVWLPDDHDADGLTPAQLRGWAAVLTAAADAADQHLNGADQ